MWMFSSEWERCGDEGRLGEAWVALWFVGVGVGLRCLRGVGLEDEEIVAGMWACVCTAAAAGGFGVRVTMGCRCGLYFNSLGRAELR